MGIAPLRHNVQGRALADGALLQSIKVNERNITIQCKTQADEEEASEPFAIRFSRMLQSLSNFFDVLAPNFNGDDTDPVIMRWVGPSSSLEIPVNYKSGMEGAFDENCIDQFLLGLVAYDPYWRDLGDSGTLLEAEQTVDIQPEAVFLIETKTGPFDMGQPDVTFAGGESGIIGMKQDPNTPDIYYAYGEFSAVGGNIRAQGIVKYDKRTGQWTDLDTGDWLTVGGGSPYVRDIWIASDGTVLAVGNFYGNDRDGTRFDAFAKWDKSGWVSFGSLTDSGSTADLRTVSIAPANIIGTTQVPSLGDIIVCGQVDTAGGVSVNNLTFYSTSLETWIDLMGVGGGITGVTSFDPLPGHYVGEIESSGLARLYVFGDINQVSSFGGGALAVNNIAQSDSGSGWDAVNSGLGTGASEWVYALAEAPDGTIYASGKFDTINGAANPGFSVAEWDGATWSALDEGVYADAGKAGEAEIRGSIDFDDDDRVWFCGIEYGNASRGFLGSAVTQTQSGTGVWNPATPAWQLPTVRFTVAPIIGASAITTLFFDSSNDIVAASNMSFDTNAEEISAQGPGQDDVSYDGTANVSPVLVIARSGGTGAEIYSLQNVTTGQIVLFDHSLEDGETMTIDLSTMDAESSIFGASNNIFDPESGAGIWALIPGENDIRLFVEAAGGATITASLRWRNRYWHLGALESL
jgi:hypothetical protein